jgi:hypothetical protein
VARHGADRVQDPGVAAADRLGSVGDGVDHELVEVLGAGSRGCRGHRFFLVGVGAYSALQEGLDGNRCGESPSKCASNGKLLSGRTDMTLRFLAIDPDTNGENCPALFLEEETGDLLFQGEAVTDRVVLAESGTHSPLGETESLVRLPARMRAIILEALSGEGSAV